MAFAIAGVATTGAIGADQKAVATAASTAKPSDNTQHWSAGGGTVGLRWNRELASDLGLSLGAASGRQARLSEREHEMFDLRAGGSLDFDVVNGNLRDFVGGSLQARGGYVIASPAGRIDLTDFQLRPRAGEPLVLDIVGADGQVMFYIDRLMFELIDDNRRLAVRTMDVRITPALAARLGHPEVAGWAIADMQITTDVLRQGARIDTPLVDYKWEGTAVPGVPGAVYQADLFMTNFTVQYSRCNGCMGEGGPGSVVFTPSSTLRNNVNAGTPQPTLAGDPLGTSAALYAADIPWFSKFTGNNAPYNNDQHPYLIWNLYRLNTDGTIDQIGRSGVKHAFLTLNTSCSDNPGNNHVLGRGCSDTYATSNNDSSNDLGPRSEIVPWSNVWGRCGSIFDVNCDGVANASGNGVYDQRMLVTESQFSGAAQTGATYLFESWYLARGDVNILNSMGTKRVSFTRNGSVWAVGGNDQYKLGPAIDRWVDPAAPGANARSVQLATAEGNVKIAVKTTDLGGGLWRYDYAVMNLDFSRAQVEGTVPNQRVTSNVGLTNFSIPVGLATVTDLSFGDGDMNAQNDWSASIANGRVTWTAASNVDALNWGTLYRFSFVVNKPPLTSTATMRIAGGNPRQTLEADGLLAPVAAGPRLAATLTPVGR